jgi:hypothetical protein
MSSTYAIDVLHYDDQGLFVSLVVGAALLIGFGGLMAFLHRTNILWLKRFYRPNHTIEPAPMANSNTAAAAARRSNPASQSPTSPSSPAGQTVFAEHTIRPHGRSGRAFVRRKRLGVSLPFTSTFFILPRFQDWISIEEPCLYDRKDGALSPVHYTTAAAPLIHTSDRSFVPIRTVCSPAIPSSPGDVQTFPTEYPTLQPNIDTATTQSDPALYSPRSAPPTPSYGAVEPSSQRRQRQQLQGSSSSAPPSPAPSSHVFQAGEPLPKTPTDPLVAVYLFTLKYFLALMLFGEMFTMWIMVIAKHGDYMKWTMQKRDIHGCGKHDDNETACNALKPYCKFRGVALGCAVVLRPGIYDLTVSNIKPRSWRWMPVASLNLCFCVVLVVLTILYLRKVGQYVEAVMANQLRYALGYRAVCIRGLDTTDIRSEQSLRSNFLELSVYFPRALSPSVSAASSPNVVANPRRDSNTYVTNDSIFCDYDPYDDSYAICECPGLNCLFSTAGVHYYVVRREDATFTEPGKVEQILITREPPFGLLDTIADTESAMANLQEAIADEKALRRKVRLQNSTSSTLRRRRRQERQSGGGRLHHHQQRGAAHSEAVPLRATSVLVSSGGGGNRAALSSVSNSSNGIAAEDHARHARETDEAVLMMRCTFPACCDKMPAVPYYESVFFKYAAELNRALEQVPHQPVAGAAFVIFKDSLCAFEFIQLFTARFGGLLSSLTATIAGPPGRIFQNTLTAGRCALYLRFFLIFWVYITLILTWSIPISFLGSLESLSQIPGLGHLLTYFTSLSSTLQALVNAYLPVLVLALFNVALPHIIHVLVRMMGAFNRTECDGGQLYLQYVFMVMTAVIAQAAFQGAMNRLTDLLFDPNEEAIINFIIACVTPTNGYFYAKIISAACLSTWMDLLDPVGVLKALLLRGSAHIQRNYDALFMPCEFEFPRLLSFDLMILSMGLLFHMTAPLLGLLTVVYFLVRYWSQRAKQTDRYRPTLSPAHDCTDFGVPAQVIRSVMWLYCFAETGGVLLMGLRDHSGGVVLCSISLGAGIALTIYVYIKTRRWTASLASARRFADTPHPFHHIHPIQYLQRQQQSRASSPQSQQPSSPASPPPPQQQQQQLLQLQQDQPTSESEPTATTPLRGSGPRHGGGASPSSVAAGGTVPFPSSARTPSLPVNGGGASEPDNAYENNPEDNPEERQLSRANRRNIVQEEGAMEGYEHVTLNQVLFDTARNPFLSHLLPRRAGVTLRFQPKHQRLAPIDVAAEVRIMHETNFVVERYWDRGMTWFEEDTADRDWDGTDNGNDSNEYNYDDENDVDAGEANNNSSAAGEEGRARSSPRSTAVVLSTTVSRKPTSSGNDPATAQLARAESTGAADDEGSPLRIRTAVETEAPPSFGRAATAAASFSSSTVVVRRASPTPATAIPLAKTAAEVGGLDSTAVWRMSSNASIRNSATASKASSTPPLPLPLRSTEESRTDEDVKDEPLQQTAANAMGRVDDKSSKQTTRTEEGDAHVDPAK